MTPRLGIDAHRLHGSRAGVGRYLSELLRAWAAAPLPFSPVVLYTPTPIPDDVLPDSHPFDVRVTATRWPVGAWQQLSLPWEARHDDLLFCPSYVSPFLFRGPTVVTIHDAIHEVMPTAFRRRDRYRALLYRSSAHRAELVLTVSEAAKTDLERHYRLPPGRVRAIPLGADAVAAGVSPSDVARVRAAYRLGERPVVLFVGKFTRRRRLDELLRAFAVVRQTGRPHLLVLVGTNHLGLPLERLAGELGVADAVRFAGHAPDDDVAALYRDADLFVYPSEYEGFGLPVLEAMAAGTPVVTLDNSSLTEIAADAAILLPEATAEALAEAMVQVLDDATLRADLVARGRRRAATYTWEATADRTLAALVELAVDRRHDRALRNTTLRVRTGAMRQFSPRKVHAEY